MSRARISVPFPGGKGTMIFSGREEGAWAFALANARSAAAARKTTGFGNRGMVELARAELDQRGRLEILAEPDFQRGVALADVVDASILLRHRQIVAGHEDAVRTLGPELPDPLDRRRTERRIVGCITLARKQLRAVLRRVSGEDRVALPAFENVDEMARGVARGGARPESRHEFLLRRDRMQRGPVLQLAHVELGHGAFAPGLVQRPRELARADDDLRVAEKDPVERVVVVRVREDHLGDVLRLQATLGELLDQPLSHAEAADVHQRDVPVSPDERYRAPAQPAVAYHPAGKTLDEDVDLVTVDFDWFHSHS